jgi:hypothetical protein
MEYNSFMEALKGKQKKLDKNHNGELDSQDFKILRKEESELNEVSDQAKSLANEIVSKHKNMKTDVHRGNVHIYNKHDEEAVDRLVLAHTGKDKEGNDRFHLHRVHSSAEDSDHRNLTAAEVHAHASKHIGGRIKESTELDEIHRMKTKLNKLDPISNRSVARQKLSNLMKSGKARGALIANKMRTLNMGDDLDQEDLDALHEVLSKDAKAGDWIHDFVNSTNPKFDGKSKKERINMALGAYYDTNKKKDGVSEGYQSHSGRSHGNPYGGGGFGRREREDDEYHVPDPVSSRSHAPVAPVPARKYIKGTPENQALKASRKPINGMPTEEVEQVEEGVVGDAVKKFADVDYEHQIGYGRNNKEIAQHNKHHKQLKKSMKTVASQHGIDPNRAANVAKKIVNRQFGEEVVNESHDVDQHFHDWTNSENAPDKSDAGDDNKIHASAMRHLHGSKVPKEDHDELAGKMADKYHGIDEEVESLEERNKQNAMMRKTMDASRGARYKLNNPVPAAEPEHKTAQAHNKAIGRALRSDLGEDKMTTTKDKSGKLISFKYEGDWKKSTEKKQGSGKAANLAGQAMQTMAKGQDLARARKNNMMTDEVEHIHELNDNLHPAGAALLKHIKPQHHNLYKPHLAKDTFNGSYRDRTDVLNAAKKAGHLEEAKDEQEYGYEGDMALNQLATLTRCAEMIKEILKPDTDMPEWVQSKITLATDYIQTAADYMHSEMNEAKSVEVKVNAAGDAPHEEKWEPVKKIKKPVVESFDDEGNLIANKVSYKEFMLEYTPGPGGVTQVKGRSYGANYSDPEGADDYDDKKPMKPAAEKRGRGRPAGAKSGARKITGTSKLMNK